MVYTMQVGDISKPFTMINDKQKEVVAIVKLKARVDQHKANISDDYQALKSIVESRKREELLHDWILRSRKAHMCVSATAGVIVISSIPAGLKNEDCK